MSSFRNNSNDYTESRNKINHAQDSKLDRKKEFSYLPARELALENKSSLKIFL